MIYYKISKDCKIITFKEDLFMKSTGIIRRMDELGRVVIPIEIRNQFNIVEKDPIEIYVNDSSIILKKYEPNCIFCGTTEDLVEYKDKLFFKNCYNELNILY